MTDPEFEISVTFSRRSEDLTYYRWDKESVGKLIIDLAGLLQHEIGGATITIKFLGFVENCRSTRCAEPSKRGKAHDASVG